MAEGVDNGWHVQCAESSFVAAMRLRRRAFDILTGAFMVS